MEGPLEETLCFTCKDPWAPSHRCTTARANYIELFSDIAQEDEVEEDYGGTAGESPANRGTPPPPPQEGTSLSPAGGVLASLCGIPKFLTLRIKATIQGQRVSVLVDNGSTHNFIDAQLVQRRASPQ